MCCSAALEVVLPYYRKLSRLVIRLRSTNEYVCTCLVSAANDEMNNTTATWVEVHTCELFICVRCCSRRAYANTELGNAFPLTTGSDTGNHFQYEIYNSENCVTSNLRLETECNACPQLTFLYKILNTNACLVFLYSTPVLQPAATGVIERGGWFNRVERLVGMVLHKCTRYTIRHICGVNFVMIL